MSSELVRVAFDGDELEAVRNGEHVDVVVKRVCEALGVDHASQQTKLKSQAWATVVMIPTVAEDGKLREVFALDLESLPMWLVTIHASKVRPELREKLVRYQRECKRVLAEHFFGSQQGLGKLAEVLGSIVSLSASVASLAKSVADQNARIEAVEKKENSVSAITKIEYASFKKAVTDVAWLEFELGWHPMKANVGTVRLAILRELASVKGVDHTGRWLRMAPAKYQTAMGWLEARERAARRAGQKRSEDRQQELEFTRH